MILITDTQPQIAVTGRVDSNGKIVVTNYVYPDDTDVVTSLEVEEASQLLRDIYAKYQAQGVRIFVTGGDIDACANEHERIGWRKAKINWDATGSQNERHAGWMLGMSGKPLSACQGAWQQMGWCEAVDDYAQMCTAIDDRRCANDDWVRQCEDEVIGDFEGRG